MSTFTDAVERLETTDKATWLGKLCWYSVSETTIPHERVVAELTAAGLEKYIPAKPADHNVFRRTFYNGQRRSYIVNDDGVKENLLIRQVSYETGVIRKRIVIETVDAKGKKLGFSDDSEGIDITFRSGGSVRIRQRSVHPAAYRLALKLKAEYNRERGCVNSDAVRNVIRQVFETCKATSVRPGGGVFFMPETHIDELDALESAATHLPGTLVHSLPLVDDEKQRNNLKACYEAETIGECDRLIAELTEITKTDTKITSERGDRYLHNLRESKAKLNEYRELLEDSLDDAEMRLQVLQRKVVQVVKTQTKDS